MAIKPGHHTLEFAFGLFGNITSFIVYLAPMPTFYRVCRRKSIEDLQSIPYVVTLLCAMLWIYYAILESNERMLIINIIGCITESTYSVIYLIYAPKKAKIFMVNLILLVDVGMFGLILILTVLFVHGSIRISIVGWTCAGFSICEFAAPLSDMRQLIRTKRIEYVPFSLSFSLTISAIMWSFYYLLLKDFHMAIANILGIILGTAQMILYVIYNDAKELHELDSQTRPSEDQEEPIEIDTDLGIQETFEPIEIDTDLGIQETFEPIEIDTDLGIQETFEPIEIDTQETFEPIEIDTDLGIQETFEPIEIDTDLGIQETEIYGTWWFAAYCLEARADC